MVVAVPRLLADAVCVCGRDGCPLESCEREHDEDVLVLVMMELEGM